MDTIDFMMSAIDYMEEHLQEEVTISDVANRIGYSLFYFSRLFHAITGHPPYDYLTRRRMVQAVNDLRNTDKKIIDIAFDYGFNNHESFSRAFKRYFGFTPMRCRKDPDLRIPPFERITEQNLRHLNRIIDFEPDIIIKDAFSVVGMQIKVTAQDVHQITRLWYQFMEGFDGITNKTKPEKTYEISYVPVGFDPDAWMMMCALEVSTIETVRMSYVGKTIPKAKYLRFIHRGRSREVGMTYRYIFQTYLPQKDYRLNIPFLFEYYGEKYYGPDDPNSESEIYIPLEIMEY